MQAKQLESLPKDTLIEISKDLSLREINRLCQTSIRLKAVFCDNPHYWKGKIEKEFPYWPIGNLIENQYFPMYKYLTARKRWFDRGGQEYEESEQLQDREEALMREAKEQLPVWGNLYAIWIDPKNAEDIYSHLYRAPQGLLGTLVEKFRDELPRYLGDADFIVIYRADFAFPIVKYYVYVDEEGDLRIEELFDPGALNRNRRFFAAPSIMYSLEGNNEYIESKYNMRGKLI